MRQTNKATSNVTVTETVPVSHGLRDASALSGAIAGAATGAVAGPIGALAGGVIGTAIGALAGVVLEEDAAERSRHDQQLDRDIGVTEGDLGAASPDQPPPRRGTFSAASSGFSSGGGSSSEGPIQEIDS